MISLAVLSCGRNGGDGQEEQGGDKPSVVKADADKGKKKAPASAVHPFPQVIVPSIYTTPQDIFEYSGEHYWDAFLEGEGRTDSLCILGVKRREVEQAMANYIAILNRGVSESTPSDREPLRTSQKMIGKFFKALESTKDTLVYLSMTELVQHYLYDPNSPLRDEDLYLPFVKGMASSPMTAPDMRKACSHEAKVCAVNQFGERASDFKFRTPSDGTRNLYGVHSEWTVLFFSNPGCSACQSIIDGILAIPGITKATSSGKVAVMSIYIDEEVDKWRAYVHNYPSDWICGYDFTFSLRDGSDYDIRAIPSVYLLDSEKRVILKDAPTERLVAYLSKLI